MATRHVRELLDRLYRNIRRVAVAHGRLLSGYMVIALERALADEKVRRKRSQALAAIRRRRHPLPKGAPDSVSMLADIRGWDDYAAARLYC